MKSLISTKLDCDSTSESSHLLLQTQSLLSQSLNNAIGICHDQFSGMRDYAISLQLLVERLRTEKSYFDLLKETELRSEETIKALQANNIELDDTWKIKYHELEHSSKIKYDNYVVESEAKYHNYVIESEAKYHNYVVESELKYATLLETTTLAYAELKAAYDKAK